MACSFLFKAGKVLDFLQSFGSEFQIVATLYAKLFCPKFGFILGGLRFKLELRSILFVTADMLLKRLDKYLGAWPLIAFDKPCLRTLEIRTISYNSYDSAL